MMRHLITGCVRILVGAGTRWVGCVPEHKQRVFFANHTSNLDGPVLWAALPADIRSRTRLVAARDYWTAGPVRRYLAGMVFNAVLIERKKVTVSNNPLAIILDALGDGYSLIIFPEGGRSRGDEPLPFKSGLYHIGRKRPDIELVPVHIDNMNRILPKGEFLPVPLLSCLTFGAFLKVGEGEGKEAFLERARRELIALKQMRGS